MSDDASFDVGSAAAMLVVIVVLLAIFIRLVPALLQMTWQVVPGILLLWLVVAILRSMLKRLVG